MILLIIGLIALCFGIILCFIAGKRIKFNSKVAEENRCLEEECEDLQKQKENLSNDVLKAQAQLQETFRELGNAAEQYTQTLENFYCACERDFDLRIAQLQYEYHRAEEEVYAAFDRYCELLDESYCQKENEYDERIQTLEINITNKIQELNKIKETLAAATEAQRRELEIEQKIDFYSLHVTATEQMAIGILEELKPRFPAPRALSKVIWETFFQKQTTTLCNNILGPGVVCGIYKITNQKTGQVYIGQSVDIATRWKDHIKCGLGIDTPVQNKLYTAMAKDGITSFTFELLEKCDRALLNEKEKFYIDLYQSYNFGYNSTKGNK